MVSELDRLAASEVELIYKTPILVCILIVGADGNIDKKEMKQAMIFAEKKQRKSHFQSYPYEATQRSPLIVEELAGINQVLRKIDPSFAQEYYKTLLSIAESIATSSGGLLGYKSIGSDEARYIKLSMVKDPSGR